MTKWLCRVLTGRILFFFFGSVKWSDAALGAEVTSVGGPAVVWEGASSRGGGATGGSGCTDVCGGEGINQTSYLLLYYTPLIIALTRA